VTGATLIRPGDIVAQKYRVERVLGVGGMGMVVAAQHVQLGTPVAIKFLLPEHRDQPTLFARFEQEAQVAGQLRSEHVARVMDAGRLPDGMPFLVMERLVGGDLDEILERERILPPQVAVDYVLQACDAVAEAHALGIVHRDLKPNNLFVTRRPDGRPFVKVLDFGIAKTANTPDAMKLTRTNEVIGSPHFMSPEQFVSSKGVDPRSDIWSLGAILYTLISGRPPFDGTSMAQICTAVLFEEPAPLDTLRPDAPPHVVAVVSRCLQKDPAHRFSSVGELVEALRSPAFALALAETMPLGNRPRTGGWERELPRPPGRRTGWVASLAVLAFLGVLGGAGWHQRAQLASLARTTPLLSHGQAGRPSSPTAPPPEEPKLATALSVPPPLPSPVENAGSARPGDAPRSRSKGAPTPRPSAHARRPSAPQGGAPPSARPDDTIPAHSEPAPAEDPNNAPDLRK